MSSILYSLGITRPIILAIIIEEIVYIEHQFWLGLLEVLVYYWILLVDLVCRTGANIKIQRNGHTLFSVTLYLRNARKYIFLYSVLIKDYSLFVLLEAICILYAISRCFQQWSNTANSSWHIGWKEMWNTCVWLQDKFKVHVVCTI